MPHPIDAASSINDCGVQLMTLGRFPATLANPAGSRNASMASLADLIGRVIRKLKAKPDLLRAYEWDNPETLNLTGINAAAAALGLGPVFGIGQAPDWAHFPNLPPDHPDNQHKVECLTVYHPDGTRLQIRRTGGMLDDQSPFPTTETIARLEAWEVRSMFVQSPENHFCPPPPSGYLEEIDAVESAWCDAELPGWQAGEMGRAVGASPWHNNSEKLAAIDLQFGVRPDDPRVYSITAYKRERDRIEAWWRETCQRRGWTRRPETSTPDFAEFFKAEYRYCCRLYDLDARHFGRLTMELGHETESRRHLWAHITKIAIVLLETLPRGADSESRRNDPTLMRVYAALHELSVPWADSPPYPPLTRQETIDKLRSIANRLEREDAMRHTDRIRETNAESARVFDNDVIVAGGTVVLPGEGAPIRLTADASGTVSREFNQMPADAEIGRRVRALFIPDNGGSTKALASGAGPPASAHIDPQVRLGPQEKRVIPDLSPVQDSIFRVLTDEFHAVRDIAARAKCDERHAYRELRNLARMGLAENKRGKGYRGK